MIAPAIDLADGFPMYDVLRDALLRERKNCERYPSTMAVYYPGGRVPEIGEMFRQPDLARTLRAIAAADGTEFKRSKDRLRAIEAGRNAFYRGDVARSLVKAARDAGGILSEDDLATFHGRIEEPLHVAYRGYEVYKPGFWTQGPVLLQTLNLLSGFDLKAMGFQSASHLHTLTEAMKLAFDDRDVFYGDPDFSKIPGAALLSSSYADSRRPLIDRDRASRAHRPGSPDGIDPKTLQSPRTAVVDAPPGHAGDTTAVNAADAAGNLFSAVVSGAWVLDGAFIAGDTGVPLSQRMQQFNLDPKSPNVVAPRKRPRITLTPTILTRDGKPYLAISTPGGDSQDQQNLNVLLAHIDFGLPIQEAIEAPRLNSEHMQQSFRDHKDEPGVLTDRGPRSLGRARRAAAARPRAAHRRAVAHGHRGDRRGDRSEDGDALRRGRRAWRARDRGLLAAPHGPDQRPRRLGLPRAPARRESPRPGARGALLRAHEGMPGSPSAAACSARSPARTSSRPRSTSRSAGSAAASSGRSRRSRSALGRDLWDAGGPPAGGARARGHRPRIPSALHPPRDWTRSSPPPPTSSWS